MSPDGTYERVLTGVKAATMTQSEAVSLAADEPAGHVLLIVSPRTRRPLPPTGSGAGSAR